MTRLGPRTLTFPWQPYFDRHVFRNFDFLAFFTAKFVVSRWAFCKLLRDFGFFCSVNHLSGGGVMQITTQRARKLLRPLAIPTRRERETFEQTLHKVEELRLVARGYQFLWTARMLETWESRKTRL